MTSSAQERTGKLTVFALKQENSVPRTTHIEIALRDLAETWGDSRQSERRRPALASHRFE